MLAYFDNRPAMRSGTDLLFLIMRFDLEAQFSAIHFEQFRGHRDLRAFRGSGEVFDVDLDAGSREIGRASGRARV